MRRKIAPAPINTRLLKRFKTLQSVLKGPYREIVVNVSSIIFVCSLTNILFEVLQVPGGFGDVGVTSYGQKQKKGIGTCFENLILYVFPS